MFIIELVCIVTFMESLVEGMGFVLYIAIWVGFCFCSGVSVVVLS